MGRSRRTKVVCIRLSQEEYEQFQTLCVRRGIDSISEVARAGMRLLLTDEGAARDRSAVESQLNEINARLSVLDREVSRLSQLVSIQDVELAQATAT
jgi:Arc/MetJ-type ribon-helix-helix transcriptional regulator